MSPEIVSQGVHVWAFLGEGSGALIPKGILMQKSVKGFQAQALGLCFSLLLKLSDSQLHVNT